MSDQLKCYVCGGVDFSFTKVLWKELIADWQLSIREVDYIDRQQGCCCTGCGNNIRSITLAKAMLDSQGYKGTLKEFSKTSAAAKIRILEINRAGGLSDVLALFDNHHLVEYPSFDMKNLKIDSESFDIVLHSDTLEHIDNPIIALDECRRVLAPKGCCLFTVPVVVDRFTRSRTGLKRSYHGNSAENKNDLVVHSEFGADAWKYVIEAGFSTVAIHCLDYPAGLAFEGRV